MNEKHKNSKISKTEPKDSDFVVWKPYWVSSTFSTEDKIKRQIKKIRVIIFKVFKIIIFSFLLIMGLWGCFQGMVENEVYNNSVLGFGLEFGFLPNSGVTNPNYVLSAAGLNDNYYTYSINYWTLEYGPFYAFFVWPGASLVLFIMYGLEGAWGGMNSLLAIILLLSIIRVVTLLISIKSTLQTEKTNEIQSKLAQINAKYKDAKDIESKRKKQIEITTLYKKYNVKPFAVFEQVFITMPIFLIIFRVITIVRPLKTTSLFEIWNFTKVPMNEIFNNFLNDGWTYIFFLLLILPIQLFSNKFPQFLAKKRVKEKNRISNKANEQMKKMKTVQTIMIVFFAFITLTSPTAVGLYWGLSALFSIGQAALLHTILMRKKQKGIIVNKKAKEFGIA